jgi:hypothetical protein
LSENKFSKYLAYAIGEILLVVIGILIALQINTWNESRKLQIEDLAFLTILKAELLAETEALTEKKAFYIGVNSNLDQAANILQQNNEINSEQHQVIVAALNDLPKLTPINKNSQRNDLKIVGGALLRLDPALNHQYLDYIENTESANDVITKLGQTLQSAVINDLYPNIDLAIMPSSSKFSIDFEFSKLQQSRAVKNAIAMSSRFRGHSINYMDQQLTNVANILSEIEDILNQHHNAKN